MASPSVIIVGAGVVGCAIAYEIAKAGARVDVIETRRPGQGATRASAGILAPYIEGHESGPLRDLGQRSLGLYDLFVDRLRADSGRPLVYERTGTLELAFSGAEAAKLGRSASALAAHGVEARWIPASTLTQVEPGVNASALGGLLIPTHGFVGVTALTLAAAAAAENAGARFTTETGALRIFPMPAGRVGVKISQSPAPVAPVAPVAREAPEAHEAHEAPATVAKVASADRVVLAAGSWSSRISVDGAPAIPVTPIRGQLIQLRAAPGSIGRVVWGPDGYLVPWPDGSVLVGATVEDVGFDESHTDDAVRDLHRAAATLIPALAGAEIVDVRTGLRPRGPDDLPLLGPSAVVPGLIYATAHYRNGVLLAPLTGALVRDLIFERATDPSLRELDPGRHGAL